MKGVITKKHFLSIIKCFGIKKAFRVLFSRKKTTLTILI